MSKLYDLHLTSSRRLSKLLLFIKFEPLLNHRQTGMFASG